jgi:1-acyl-sn-glycerol-3-phosphate acyltransferase
VPKSAEEHTEPREDRTFPTDWARTEVGTAARQVLLGTVMKGLVNNALTIRVHGTENLEGVDGPVMFVSNHSSHLDATLIMVSLPNKWQAHTAVGAAKDYFFDVWWRQAFTALVFGGFPIERGGGSRATSKARELIDDGWSLVVFPEGSRSPDGHMQRFRHGASRLCLEAQIPVVPIGIRGAYQAMPKGRNWPRPGRPPVTLRFGEPLYPVEGETHQQLSLRMTHAVERLHDEDRTTWWDALRRDEAGETPPLHGPAGPDWIRTWEGMRPLPKPGRGKTWE